MAMSRANAIARQGVRMLFPFEVCQFVRRIAITRIFIAIIILSSPKLWMHAQTTALQATPLAPPQPIVVGAGSAFSHATVLHTIILTGVATRGAGASAQSGSATLIARSDGSGSTQISAGNYSEAEEYPVFSSSDICLTAPNAIPSQEFYPRRCVGSTLWYLPQISILLAKSDPTLVTELPSNAVSGVTIYRRRPKQSRLTPDQVKALSSSALTIDSSSMLVTQNAFTISPLERPSLKIPMTVLYSDYFTSNGITVPGRIRRYVGGTLQLDLHVTSIALGN
jgi:hypothetical protein